MALSELFEYCCLCSGNSLVKLIIADVSQCFPYNLQQFPNVLQSHNAYMLLYNIQCIYRLKCSKAIGGWVWVWKSLWAPILRATLLRSTLQRAPLCGANKMFFFYGGSSNWCWFMVCRVLPLIKQGNAPSTNKSFANILCGIYSTDIFREIFYIS